MGDETGIEGIVSGDETGIEGIVSRGQPQERGVEGGGIWRVRGDWKKREHRSDFVGWRPYLPPPGKGIAPWGRWGDGAQASNAYTCVLLYNPISDGQHIQT